MYLSESTNIFVDSTSMSFPSLSWQKTMFHFLPLLQIVLQNTIDLDVILLNGNTWMSDTSILRWEAQRSPRWPKFVKQPQKMQFWTGFGQQTKMKKTLNLTKSQQCSTFKECTGILHPWEERKHFVSKSFQTTPQPRPEFVQLSWKDVNNLENI